MQKRSVIISITNQKGGVGKTSTICALAEVLVNKGFKVGVIDTDQQSNTTSILGKPPYQISESIVALLDPDYNRPISTLFHKAKHDGELYILPSTIKAASAWPQVYFKINEFMGNIYSILRTHLQQDQVITEDFDFILIDTPPSLDLPMLNSLAASDYVIVPVQSGDPFSLDGWNELHHTIERVRKSINPQLQIMGVLLTFHDPRYTVCKSNYSYVHKSFGKLGIPVFDTYISATVEVKMSHAARMPVTLFNRGHKVSEQYEDLANEIIQITGKAKEEIVQQTTQG
jgi:chromosome partitioning protein